MRMYEKLDETGNRNLQRLEIDNMEEEFTHFDNDGNARMVDVSDKVQADF